VKILKEEIEKLGLDIFGRAKQASRQTGLLERLKLDITLAKDKINLRVLIKIVM
jgi:hypothetical protein